MIITKTTPFTKDEIKIKNRIALESLAMDLKRASIFLNRKSEAVGNRFLEEALKRKSEIEILDLKNYMKKIIWDLDNVSDPEKLLMYSTIIQNYILKF